MKKLITILLANLPVLFFAQEAVDENNGISGEKKDQMITYTIDSNNDTTGMNIWQYHGRIAEWAYMTKEKGEWIFRKRSQRNYDDKGNLLSNMYQECKGNLWVNKYYELYSYDAHNNKREYLLLEFKGKKWTTVSGERINYSYTKDGLITEIIYELWNRDAWIKDWRTEFVYNKEVLVCSLDYQFIKNEWSPTFKNEYDWYKWEGNVSASVLRTVNSFISEEDGNWVQIKRPYNKKNFSAVITYN